MARYFDLVVFDDIVPSGFSPFRTVEYSHYLNFFHSAVVSLEGWHLWIENTTFEENLRSNTAFNEANARVFTFPPSPETAARLAYVTFLGNAYRMLPYFEAAGLPFIVQLYPGGGFELGQADSDKRLREVVNSPLCRKIISTQSITSNYLINTIDCDPNKIEFIFGGVFKDAVKFDFSTNKIMFGRDKATLDLCFVAHKYGDDLVSKGYAEFVALAKELASRFPHLQFHVIGDYEPNDCDLGTAADRFTFYGRQPSSFFVDFYPKMDIVVSPNKPFVLAPGAFDGFPTGSCVEAGFYGVLNAISDPLGLNIEFEDGVDIVLLDENFSRSVERLSQLLDSPSELYLLARRNWQTFRRVLGVDAQLWARSKTILRELMKLDQLVALPSSVVTRLTTSETANLIGPLESRIYELETAYVELRDYADKLERKFLNRVIARARSIVGRHS